MVDVVVEKTSPYEREDIFLQVYDIISSSHLRRKANCSLASLCESANSEHLPYLQPGNRIYFAKVLTSANFLLMGKEEKVKYILPHGPQLIEA